MTGPTRRSVLKFAAAGGAFAATGLAAPAILRAQSYPSQPINMVVPFATGGYNDRLARAFSPFLQETLGQPVNVVNRPGGNTIIGHQYVLQQPMDGHTILCTSASPYIPLSIMLHEAPYEVDDFWMINLPSRDLTLAAAPSTSGLESFAQAMDMLKDDPGSLSLGVQPASADYVNLMLSLSEAGIDPEAVRIVTYDGGGPARNAAAGGHVDIAFVGAEGFLPLIEQIKPLMLYADDPADIFPDTPERGRLRRGDGRQRPVRRGLAARLGDPDGVEGRERGGLRDAGERARDHLEGRDGHPGAAGPVARDHLVRPGRLQPGVPRDLRRADRPHRPSGGLRPTFPVARRMRRATGLAQRGRLPRACRRARGRLR